MSSILIIDDHESVRRLVRQALEGAGYTVVEASSSHEGLRLFREAPTDVILTDSLMPYEDGLETTEQLCREFPDVKTIIFTDRTADRRFLDLVKLLWANGTLMKPFELRDLRDTVRRVLEN
ncbi:MAG TPA: response regulator [Nitrospiraceae bacterium]|jgi:CheY-like chemotaxis protein|nr:response regulator [Nitrospiraceae bacterium]